MKSIAILTFSLTLLYALQSCNSTPDAFTKGYEYYTVQSYDSSLYYFDRLLPENEEWLDSAKAMKIKCFEGMAKNHKWAMLGAANSSYSADTLLIAEGAKYLERELTSIWKKDSLDMLYRVIDQHKTKLPNSAITGALNSYEDEMLLGYYWKGIKFLKGQKLYFTREAIKDYKGNDDDLKIHGKSALKTSFWKKNIAIYKNISYDSAGIYQVHPRIYKGYKQYFSKRGSMKFIGNDTIKINYEQRLSSSSKVYFVRGDKIEAEDVP
ncbi:hypothetical protein N8328_04060 [Crocinitomicaceae bacterium]|nr:hypothetical protein [Crocinitomicaceae bacterium]